MALPLKKQASDITTLLEDYRRGEPEAFDALMPLVYNQLKKIASQQMRGQRGARTLSATGLVHEAFLKMKNAGALTAKDRSHFFAIAARTMRWLLIDYARAKRQKKRGGEGPDRIVFDENIHSSDKPEGWDPLILHDVLERLERQSPRLCRIVELRHLVGLSIEETADALGVSTMTVKREWLIAKAWLARELEIDSAD